MSFNIRQNILLQIRFYRIVEIIRRKRFLFRPFLCRLIIHQHVCLIIIFIRPPGLIQLRPVRSIFSVCQRSQNIVQQNILVQQIRNVIEHIVIIKIIGKRKLRFLRIRRERGLIHRHIYSFYLIALCIKYQLHDIG